MGKFIILYTKGLYGAIVGTESGQVLSIPKEKIHDQEWIENHTSKVLKVFRVSKLDEISNSVGTTQIMPKGILDVAYPIEPETFTVNESRFSVIFQGCYSSGTKTWIIEEKPFILP